jgi:uncharacterized protein
MVENRRPLPRFEFDERKSRINKLKHGIDFDAAQELWRDPWLAHVRTAYPRERRFLAIGRIGEKHWSAVSTYRGGVVRLISVRRSAVKEVQIYEGQ